MVQFLGSSIQNPYLFQCEQEALGCESCPCPTDLRNERGGEICRLSKGGFITQPGSFRYRLLTMKVISCPALDYSAQFPSEGLPVLRPLRWELSIHILCTHWTVLRVNSQGFNLGHTRALTGPLFRFPGAYLPRSSSFSVSVFHCPLPSWLPSFSSYSSGCSTSCGPSWQELLTPSPPDAGFPGIA